METTNQTGNINEYGEYSKGITQTAKKAYIYWEQGQKGYETLLKARAEAIDITAFMEAVLSGGKMNGTYNKVFVLKVLALLKAESNIPLKKQ